MHQLHSCLPWAQLLWHMGLVAPRLVESSRDGTHVPCSGINCAPREDLILISAFKALSLSTDVGGRLKGHFI